MSDRYRLTYVLPEMPTREGVGDLVATFHDRCETVWPEGERDTHVEKLYDEGGIIAPSVAGTDLTFILHDDHDVLGLPNAQLTVPEQAILTYAGESDEAALDRMDDLYAFFDRLYEWFVDSGCPPVYVFGLNFVESAAAYDEDHVNHVSRERILNAELPGIFWFQILTPAFVEELGADLLASTPAYRLEHLDDGAVSLAATQGVFVSDAEEYTVEASEHLGVPFER